VGNSSKGKELSERYTIDPCRTVGSDREWNANTNPQTVLITEDLREEAVHFLEQGGRVLLLAGPGKFGRRTSYFPSTGGAMGVYVRPNSPALLSFPNDGFCDLQFFNLFEGGVQFDLSSSLDPIVGGIQMIRGAKNTFKRVSYLAEAKVGRGSLLMSALNIEPNLDEANPEVVSMFDDLMRYAASPQFQPTAIVPIEEIDNLRVPYTEMIH
jgi:hypothetical protein